MVIDDCTSKNWLKLYNVLGETLKRYWEYPFLMSRVPGETGGELPKYIRVRLGKKIKVVKPHYRTEVTYNFWGKRTETSVPDGTSSVEEVICIALFDIDLKSDVVYVSVTPALTEEVEKDRKEIKNLLERVERELRNQLRKRNIKFIITEDGLPKIAGMDPD